MIADWIDAELRNWAAWCWEGPWPHPLPPDHAASAEGHYRAPIIEDEDAERPKVRANRQRAEIVHAVYMERLTQRERWVLVYRYVRPTTQATALRRLRCTRRDWETALFAAARCVGEAFRESRQLIGAEIR